MSVTLTVTTGAANEAASVYEVANSYQSLADAETNLALISPMTKYDIDTTGWNAATDDQKKVALIQAAKVIDTAPFAGDEQHPNQARAWGRTGTGKSITNSVVPTDILWAQVAEAAQSFTARSEDEIAAAKGVTSVSVGDESVSFKSAERALDTMCLAAREILKASGLLQTGVGRVHLGR
jgi:hypothetical protein